MSVSSSLKSGSMTKREARKIAAGRSSSSRTIGDNGDVHGSHTRYGSVTGASRILIGSGTCEIVARRGRPTAGYTPTTRPLGRSGPLPRLVGEWQNGCCGRTGGSRCGRLPRSNRRGGRHLPAAIHSRQGEDDPVLVHLLARDVDVAPVLVDVEQHLDAVRRR